MPIQPCAGNTGTSLALALALAVASVRASPGSRRPPRLTADSHQPASPAPSRSRDYDAALPDAGPHRLGAAEPVPASRVKRSSRDFAEALPWGRRRIARTGLNGAGATWPELHQQCASKDIDRRLVLAVMMPTGHHAGLGASNSGPHAVGGDGLLTIHPRRRGLGFRSLRDTTRISSCSAMPASFPVARPLGFFVC